MLRVELPALIGRLNAIARQGLEGAAALCAEQQAAEVGASHLLLAFLDQPLCDLRVLLEAEQIEPEALRRALVEDARPPRDLAVTTPSFSPLLVELLQDAWLLASTEFGQSALRTGAIFTALLHHAERYLGPRGERLLAGINRERLRRDFARLTRDSAEAVVAQGEGPAPARPATGDDSALSRFENSRSYIVRRFAALSSDDGLQPDA